MDLTGLDVRSMCVVGGERRRTSWSAPGSPASSCSSSTWRLSVDSVAGTEAAPDAARPGSGRADVQSSRVSSFGDGRRLDRDGAVDDRCLSSSILVLELLSGIVESASWYGARPTPPFSSVPTYGVVAEAVVDRVLDRLLARRRPCPSSPRSAGCRSTPRPRRSRRCRPRCALAPLSLAAWRPPRPAGPATGKMMSAPCSISCSADGLALGLVLEVLGERARPCRPSRASLTSVPLVLVVLLDALPEAVHEDRHGRDRQAAEGADDAGFGLRRGQVAGEVGRLGGVEGQALEVLGGVFAGLASE